MSKGVPFLRISLGRFRLSVCRPALAHVFQPERTHPCGPEPLSHLLASRRSTQPHSQCANYAPNASHSTRWASSQVSPTSRLWRDNVLDGSSLTVYKDEFQALKDY